MNVRSMWTAAALVALFCGTIDASGQNSGSGGTARPRPLPSLPSVTKLTIPKAPAAPTVIEAGRKLTVQEAVRIALANHPDVGTASASVLSASGSLLAHRSGLGPQITLFVSHQSQNSATVIASSGAPTGGSGGLSGIAGSANVQVQQLLYDFGRTSASVAAARDDLAGAQQALRGARNQVVLGVKRAYYAYLENQRLTAVAEQQFDDQKKHLAQADALYSAGQVPWGDVARASASVASAQAALSGVQRDELVARLGLAQAMGIDPRADIDVAEESEEAELTAPEALVGQALNNRPELARARASLAAARERAAWERMGNAPKLSATAGASASNSGLVDISSGQMFVGVTLQATPFDSGLTRGRTAQARADVASAESSLRNVEQSICRAVLAAYLDLQTAIRQASAADVQAASAEESLRVAEGRYQAAQGALLDVMDAQTVLNEARVRQVNARAQISTSTAGLAYELGKPEDREASIPAPMARPDGETRRP